MFEPSEIRARLLTEDDELIRGQDIPERMQLATSTLSRSSTLSMHRSLTDDDLEDAAHWVLLQLSSKERDYFRHDGQYFRLLESLVASITFALRSLFVQAFEVPYIWAHKRDYVSYFNASDIRTRVDLLDLNDLWRVYAVGQKYRSLIQRRAALETFYTRLNVTDDYFENEIRRRSDSVEVIADATEWLVMKYKDSKKEKDHFALHFHDDEEQIDSKKWKMPSRISAYEVTKRSIISKLAEVYFVSTLCQMTLNM